MELQMPAAFVRKSAFFSFFLPSTNKTDGLKESYKGEVKLKMASHKDFEDSSRGLLLF